LAHPRFCLDYPIKTFLSFSRNVNSFQYPYTFADDILTALQVFDIEAITKDYFRRSQKRSSLLTKTDFVINENYLRNAQSLSHSFVHSINVNIIRKTFYSFTKKRV